MEISEIAERATLDYVYKLIDRKTASMVLSMNAVIMINQGENENLFFPENLALRIQQAIDEATVEKDKEIERLHGALTDSWKDGFEFGKNYRVGDIKHAGIQLENFVDSIIIKAHGEETNG